MYGSIESDATEAAPTRGRRTRGLLAVVVAAAALAGAAAAVTVLGLRASSAELVQEEAGGRRDDAAGGQKDDCKLATVAAESAINGRFVWAGNSVLSKDGKTFFHLSDNYPEDDDDILKIYRYDTATGEQIGGAAPTGQRYLNLGLDSWDASPDATIFALADGPLVKLHDLACHDGITTPPATPCVNDDSTNDERGRTCSSWYDRMPFSCGNYDDDDFIASLQCCACIKPCVTTIAKRGDRHVRTLRFSPDGKYLAVGGRDDMIAWYDADGTLLYERALDANAIGGESANVIAFSPDSKLLAVGATGLECCKFGLIVIYEVETGKRERKVKPHLVDWGTYLLEFSPDGKTLMYGGSDGTFKFYDMDSATVRATSRQFGSGVGADGWLSEKKLTAFSPDGRYFAFGRTIASGTEFAVYNTTTVEPIEDWEILDGESALYGFRGDQLVRVGRRQPGSRNSQVQLVNIATEEDCTPMPTTAPTVSPAPTLAPTLAPTPYYQSDAAPARAIILPVVAALAAAAMM